MPSTWIAIVLSACTLCGGLAVVEFNGVLATLVKVLYAVSTLSLAGYLALHGSEEPLDDPAPGEPARIAAPDASKA